MTVRGHIESVYSLEFLPNSASLVICSSGSTIRLWDVQSGVQESDSVSSPLYWADVVAVSRDGALLASAGRYIQLALWDFVTQTIKVTLEHWSVRTLSFSPTGDILVSRSLSGQIQLWTITAVLPTRKETGSPLTRRKCCAFGSHWTGSTLHPYHATRPSVFGTRAQVLPSASRGVGTRKT